jgi:zinc protease
VVVVVGNIKSDEVLELAKTYFDPLKPINIPELKPRKESSSLGTRRIQINANATVPRLFMSYNAPCIFSASDPTEPYALLVLIMALDGGNSARFSKELIREQTIATSIFSYYNPFALHETLMMFSAIPTKDHTMAELEQALTKQIVRLQTEPLSEQELKRIKTNAIAQHTFGKDSMTDQAIEIGSYEGIGLSWKDAEIYPEKIQAITATDVQKVAHKYLVPERLTVAELIPLNTGN